MTQPPRLHLFQAYGVELEYMIVDRDTLNVRPISDELLKHEIGSYASDYENGIVTWSNELVLHVIELKSTKPEINLNGLEHAFSENVRKINTILTEWNAMLMPTAAHPFMNPFVETKLWSHDNNDVYEKYNEMFDCKGHGWSNLQSTHLNLPFYDDEEFAKLHAAVRLILPILPALCASSPMLDGKFTDMVDTRMQYYKTNQSKLPSITGKIIPEGVFSKRNYINTIYEKIKTDIAPYDTESILNPIWVNSRGAIPRFDRGSIEIRIMDIQECPASDMAIVALVIETLKCLMNGKFLEFENQMKWKTDPLAELLDKTILTGSQTRISDPEYLSAFSFPGRTATCSELWKHILDKISEGGNNTLNHWRKELDVILAEGSLSERMMRALRSDSSTGNVKALYRQLCGCLDQNKMFLA
jgi:gamma-glutamyl:cysteine ligase YbdK (ATP-grasp superfamily)